jgi:hypothetical protein
VEERPAGTLVVRAWVGSRSCYTSELVVREDARTVRVKVVDRSAGFGRRCDAVAIEITLSHDLQAPVGDRTVDVEGLEPEGVVVVG